MKKAMRIRVTIEVACDPDAVTEEWERHASDDSNRGNVPEMVADLLSWGEWQPIETLSWDAEAL